MKNTHKFISSFKWDEKEKKNTGVCCSQPMETYQKIMGNFTKYV